jgi:hypothetical protein
MSHADQTRQVDRLRGGSDPVTLHPSSPDVRQGPARVETRSLPLAHWCAASQACEPAVVLAIEARQCTVPAGAAVLDVGCGPGQHTGCLTDALTSLPIGPDRAFALVGPVMS